MEPCGIMAEDLALEKCMAGIDIRHAWSEREMVCSRQGQQYPGTPDGMFQTWGGRLICVQVVRVPIRMEMSAERKRQQLLQTMLTKVSKSSTWLQASRILPQDFVIFCWLPCGISNAVAEQAFALMRLVQEWNPTFSLRLCVPSDASALFPATFARQEKVGVARNRNRTAGASDCW